MSILVIGGDKIDAIKSILQVFGASSVVHWDARKKSVCKKIIPIDIECVVMLTSFLNHNAMKYFRSEAKKRDLPVVCSKHNSSCFYDEYKKIMGSSHCLNCETYSDCTIK
ncbi:MAG: DUF2325 domain-containing protein [Sulfurimonas sp.]|jgi:hypothetical protein|uniref:DUF2325 domain-containing protein n=1 Tax=Sulfurimonas sp. TaxID=2022749 RepID=UPI000CCF6804|nr:MAG: hypothetical protein C0627_11680 [Sulfurimonas sp.]